MEHTDIQTLASRVEGPVLLPGDEGYDEERTGANLAVRRELELIFGAARGGVLVTTSRMTGVEVDPDRRTVRVGAGVRFEQVIPATVPHELAPLNGSAPHVDVVSYVLGGGVGLLVRTYGYASDRVRGLELVTADGELRRVTADSEPDLHRAVVGGHDDFGCTRSSSRHSHRSRPAPASPSSASARMRARTGSVPHTHRPTWSD